MRIKIPDIKIRDSYRTMNNIVKGVKSTGRNTSTFFDIFKGMGSLLVQILLMPFTLLVIAIEHWFFILILVVWIYWSDIQEFYDTKINTDEVIQVIDNMSDRIEEATKRLNEN